MPHKFSIAMLLLFCAALAAGEADSSDPLPDAAITAQDQGLVKGSFNPAKRGIKLPPNAKIMVIPLNDETTKWGYIDEWQAMFLKRRLRVAEREKYDLIVIEIDTNGGLLEPAKEMVKVLENCKVPVVAYIKNKAMSGGAILSLGTRMIVMEPGSEIGSAKAVMMSGGMAGSDFTVAMRQKVDAGMRAYVRGLCDSHGHPHALAEGMVSSSVEVIETNDPNQRYMTDDDFASASKRGTINIKTVKKKDQILAVNAKEAVNMGLAAGTAASISEVALGLGVTNPQISRMDISSAEIVARFFSNPWWKALLVIVGLIALFVELASPSHGLGYAGFAICMGMFFYLQIFSNNAGIFEMALFSTGVILVAIELFVLPAFGTLGFVGISFVIVSIILAFLPEGSVPGLLGYSGKPTEYVMKQMIEGMEWATLTLLSFIGFFALSWWRGISMPGMHRLALHTVSSGTVSGGSASSARLRAIKPDGTVGPGTKLGALVGLTGTAETVLRPAGKIRLEGATYDAVSEGGYIEAGTVVKVLRAQGSALVVRHEEKS